MKTYEVVYSCDKGVKRVKVSSHYPFDKESLVRELEYTNGKRTGAKNVAVISMEAV